MKGLSLPINAIIIIGLAILVLVVIAAFFGANISIGARNIEREQALDRACREFRDLNRCTDIDSTEVIYEEPGQTCFNRANKLCKLTELCYIQGLTPTECAKRCGC